MGFSSINSAHGEKIKPTELDLLSVGRYVALELLY